MDYFVGNYKFTGLPLRFERQNTRIFVKNSCKATSYESSSCKPRTLGCRNCETAITIPSFIDADMK